MSASKYDRRRHARHYTPDAAGSQRSPGSEWRTARASGRELVTVVITESKVIL